MKLMEYKKCNPWWNKKGDIVISKAGDKIAVDGEIIEGNTHLDESFITGESKPVTKGIGEK